MAIVVNADDFGLSEAVNDAILQSFTRGWVSSATILANMPFFEQAVELVHLHRLTGKIGVHLNLTQGVPLTDEMRRHPRLCTPDGQFRARPRDLAIISPGERKAIHQEWRAQILACRTRGFEPTHLDSHHQVHTYWAVGGVTIDIAKEFHIRFIRLSHNAGAGISRMHRMYSSLFNRRLRLSGLAGVRYFCELGFATQKLLDVRGGIEVMVHPTMDASGGVTDPVFGGALGPAIVGLMRGRQYISYGDLASR
jgi:predicted glycoside hydrolase/deacetylase ChbG (UPF0249 family)